jgi:hypothetical protein
MGRDTLAISAMISTYGWEKPHAFFGKTQVSIAKIWGSSLKTCPWMPLGWRVVHWEETVCVGTC